MEQKDDSDLLLTNLRAALGSAHEQKKERPLQKLISFFRRKKFTPQTIPPDKKNDAA
jgi:hypothetical protein